MKFAMVSGESGKSKVISVKDLDLIPSATGMEVDTDVMWTTKVEFSALDVPLDGREGALLVDLRCPPGTSHWKTIFIRPNVELYAHRTDTYDYDTILKGEVTVLLDEGEMTFTAGDSVLIMGVRHGWRTGPEGAYMSVANFGILPLAGEPAG